MRAGTRSATDRTTETVADGHLIGARGRRPRAFTAMSGVPVPGRKRSFRPERLVAPVEVAAAAPETLFGVRACMLRGVLAGPGENGRLGRDRGLLAVHRLLQPGLL